jgi:hypothetical protein
MSRIRLILLSLAAITAIGAVTSASASAHRFIAPTCKEGTNAEAKKWGNEKKCIERNPAAGETGKWEHNEVLGKVKGTSGVSKLKSMLLGAEILITCKKDTFSGELEAKGATKGEVTFEECSASSSGSELTNCEVPNIKFKFTDQLVGSPVEDEFKPAVAGKPFVEIVIKNKGAKICLEKGTFPVEGTQKCELPSGETFKTEHEIKCTPAGSSLKFNKTETATFESTDTVKLEAGGEWAVE